MWDEQKRQRFQDLRSRSLAGDLQASEFRELELLTEELEAVEAASLKPPTERMRTDREQLEAENHALETLVRRKQELARRMVDFLAEVREERRAIEGELSAVLVGHTTAANDG